KNSITVKIMDRDFTVKCPLDKVQELHKAAKYFDNKLREIHGDITSKKLVSTDNLIIITALNITHELIGQKHQNRTYIDGMNQQLDNLYQLVEQALTDEK
ncbi:MAG: cell division protein ZapA, partial [Gammaproteobacteria bacterium]|nr:cell division protein ZapA [Gammaproteobacteria bacterium]